MLTVPPDLAHHYDAALERAAIEPTRLAHYRKWLRYYLDFCAKYRFNPEDRDSLKPAQRDHLESVTYGKDVPRGSDEASSPGAPTGAIGPAGRIGAGVLACFN